MGALIVKFTLEPDQDYLRLSEVQAALSRFETKSHPKIFLRPGATEEQGYLWIVSLDAELSTSLQVAIRRRESETHFSRFRELWVQLMREAGETGAKSTAWRKAKRGASAVLMPA